MYPASSNSSALDGEPQQDGVGPELAPWGAELDADYAMPFPRRLRIKHRLLRSFFLFLPAYLSTLFTSFYYLSRSAPSVRLLCFSQDIPLQYLGTLSLSISSFPRLFLVYKLFPSSNLLYLLSAMPKKKSPEDFFQRAREKGSDINKAIVNSTAVKKHLEPKTEKNYGAGIGSMEWVGLPPWPLALCYRSPFT